MPLDTRITLDAQIGPEIRAWRTARGLSQRGAAEALSVSRRALQDWEIGGKCQCATLLRAHMALLDKCEPASLSLDL